MIMILIVVGAQRMPLPKKKLEGLEINERRIVTMQTTASLKSTRIYRRVLET